MRAGNLRAELVGADLARIRWGGLEVASAIQVTVRDERWDTLAPRVRRATVDERSDGFTVALDVVHGDDGFAWHGAVRADDGALELEMSGSAERDLVYRRIGICVLHPWAGYAGARFVASGRGTLTEGVFPSTIAPQPRVAGEYQPLVPAFDRLVVDLDHGVRAAFAFEGEDDGFELEDQRNWTDPSFKTYTTPLRSSAPRTIRRGATLWQRLRLEVTGPPPPPPEDHAGPIVVRVGEVSERPMPEVGVSAPSGSVDLGHLGELEPAHLRVAAAIPGRLDDLRAAAVLGAASRIPLEVALLLDDEEADLSDARSVLSDAPLARVLLLRGSGETADGPFVSRVRATLDVDRPDLAVLGGTASHFSELNRSVPNPLGMDGVALAISPQVHAADEGSMTASLEIQSMVVEQLHRLTGLPVSISPVTLAVHDLAEDVVRVDDRVGSAFAAAWSLGSVSALAAAGATSVTLHESVDRTILGSPELVRVLRLVTARRGRGLSDTVSSDPRCVRALAATGSPLVLVNLTPDDVEATIDVAGGSPTVRLGPYEISELDPSLR